MPVPFRQAVSAVLLAAVLGPLLGGAGFPAAPAVGGGRAVVTPDGGGLPDNLGGDPIREVWSGIATAAVAAYDAAPGTATYRSPTYGYCLTWPVVEDGWEVRSEASRDGVDALQLTNGVSVVYLYGAEAHDGDAGTCVRDNAEQLRGNPSVDNVAPMEDEAGEPVAGGEGDAAYAVFTLLVNGEESFQRIECRELLGDEAILLMYHVAPLAAFDEESEAFTDLTARLRMPLA